MKYFTYGCNPSHKSNDFDLVKILISTNIILYVFNSSILEDKRNNRRKVFFVSVYAQRSQDLSAHVLRFLFSSFPLYSDIDYLEYYGVT